MFKKISENKIICSLSSFAQKKGKKLYVVGGVVRDLIFGVIRSENITDFDLCGTLELTEVVEFAKTNDIKYAIKNKKLQVIMLEDECGIYEYARLRKEEYKDGLSHTPQKIEFVEDVYEDAKRRDFTVNSIYYATHSTEIVDPFGGIDDINNKYLRTVLAPEETLSVDPARVLRMVEVMARFNLTADKNTIGVAKDAAKNITKLTAARLQKEISRIKHFPKYANESPEYLTRVKDLLRVLNIDYIL